MNTISWAYFVFKFILPNIIPILCENELNRNPYSVSIWCLYKSRKDINTPYRDYLEEIKALAKVDQKYSLLPKIYGWFIDSNVRLLWTLECASSLFCTPLPLDRDCLENLYNFVNSVEIVDEIFIFENPTFTNLYSRLIAPLGEEKSLSKRMTLDMTIQEPNSFFSHYHHLTLNLNYGVLICLRIGMRLSVLIIQWHFISVRMMIKSRSLE